MFGQLLPVAVLRMNANKLRYACKRAGPLLMSRIISGRREENGVTRTRLNHSHLTTGGTDLSVTC